MDCMHCHMPIEPDSKFCRHCGGAQQVASPSGVQSPTGLELATSSPEFHFSGWIVAGIVGLIVAVALASSEMQNSKSDSSSASSASDIAATLAAATEAANDAAASESAAQAAASAPAENWSYSSDEDKVRGGTTYYASTTSTNSIHQDPPYSDATTMRITVRKSPAYGTDVLLTISSGQMMCPSYEGCHGTVRFDDGPAERVSFSGAADNDSETVFVDGAKSFIQKLKKSKRVVIEKTLYQAGNPQFEFNVSGLKWDH